MDRRKSPVRKAAPPSSSAQQRKKRRFRGLTCANCRTRKVRCEGSQPTCKTCEAFSDTCRYDKAPPLSQIVAMAQRLQEAEKTLEMLRAGAVTVPTPAGTSSLPPGGSHVVSASVAPAAAASTASPVAQMRTAPLPGALRPPMIPTPSSASTPAEPTTMDISVDEHGKICYYGATSAVHDPPDLLESPSARSSTAGTMMAGNADLRPCLASLARESAIWEEFALGNASLRSGLPRQVMAKLLHLHWTWVAPMFMWVYKPAFIRDMTTNGAYFSEFLLVALCAHAAKYQDGQYADLLLVRVRQLLGDAIQQPSSIPTVQALLQLRAKEMAQGDISQAWVYSGIAFRMATDLGLQHNGPVISGLKGLGPVDLEIRRRLLWSCYFWDKAISLYTGRVPAIAELPSTPADLLDTSPDAETWSPYYEDSLALTRLPPGQYPAMKSHMVSCFANSCKLSVIINDIITQLYSRRSRPITEVCLEHITQRLHLWRAQSPSYLKYDPDFLPSICPPPHIISQNLLYFASVILAHRPFWSAPDSYRVCIHASQSIEKLILLLESTFGLENITYLMGYCIYTGASAMLEDAKNGESLAGATMQTFLRALNTAMRKCPLLERSLHIIIKGMKRPPAQPPTAVQVGGVFSSSNNGSSSSAMETHSLHHGSLASSMSNTAGRNIPAFPNFDATSPSDFDMEAYLSANMDPMVLLDCFPELQTDPGFMGHAVP